ncbi:MAG: Ig-like domain repeat protein, partial [Terriglobales bacterium]
TTTTITNTIPQATHPLKVEVYFTVTNGMNAVAGNVTVTASSGEHCTGTVLGGKCLLTFLSADVGSQTLTATYPGNTNDAASTSSPFPLTVN